ncbi:MAG TPA: hypothetical protein VGQ21_01050 [Thermoanaerobaculia bacterium]|nr:hypothetical protein [Thermoanaerobaculia bacterium]
MTALLFMMGAAAASPRLPNACQLLTARDIARVQGQEFKSAKLTETEANGLIVSQCFYALPSFTSSVSVDVMRGKTSAFWRGHFSNARDAADHDEVRDRDRSAAMKSAPPSREAEEEHQTGALKVKGIGDAAVWSGNRAAGALYVLKGETIVRVSVGGAGSQEQKIERSKKLAARALRKL